MKKLFRSADSPAKALNEIFGGYTLPTFPRLVAAALEKIAGSDADLIQVAEILKGDPGSSVHILQLVNSASFAPRRPIVDLHQAVTMLGRNQLESLLISYAASRVLPAGRAPGFNSADFWATAYRRAAAAASFANLVDPRRRSQNFTAALLQDLAIPVLAHRQEGYGDLLDRWLTEGADLGELERAAYGWDHAQVGGLMCQAWDFPDELGAAIGSHHEPVDASDILPLVKVVASVCDLDRERDQEVFLSHVSELFALQPEQAQRVLVDALDEAAASSSMFG